MRLNHLYGKLTLIGCFPVRFQKAILPATQTRKTGYLRRVFMAFQNAETFEALTNIA